MTDNEITREKTFSEELPYFNERIKEVFDNYDNPNGYEDPLYIAVLRDSKRVVRKAEEEITRQQAEIENLKVENQSLRGAANSLKMHYEEAQAEVDSLKIFRGYAEKRASDYRTMRDKYLNAKSEAYKEFAERVKEFMHNKFKALDEYEFEYITERDIDDLLKEMVGENND